MYRDYHRSGGGAIGALLLILTAIGFLLILLSPFILIVGGTTLAVLWYLDRKAGKELKAQGRLDSQGRIIGWHKDAGKGNIMNSGESEKVTPSPKITKDASVAKSAITTDTSGTLSAWFVGRWSQSKLGETFRLEQIEQETGLSADTIIDAVKSGIRVTNYSDRNRWQNIVFTGASSLGLDTENTVRACLSKYLVKKGYLVYGRAGEEVDFRNSDCLRRLARYDGKSAIHDYFSGCVAFNGIDLVAYKDGRVLVIEVKGITAAKSDLNDTIFQMLDRYRRMKQACSEEAFARVDFACAFPSFYPDISRDHYRGQFATLRRMREDYDPSILYSFAAATSTVKADGVELMKPFVESSPNVCDFMNSGKMSFFLVETESNAQTIGHTPSYA